MAFPQLSPRLAAIPKLSGRGIAVALVLASLVNVLVGVIRPPVAIELGYVGQAGSLIRVVLSVCTVVTLLILPGVVIRNQWRRWQEMPTALLPTPGIVLMSGVGFIVWALSRNIDPHTSTRILLVPLLALLLVGAWTLSGPIADADEGRVFGFATLAFLAALGRTLWSEGPKGELYSGTISRTLEPSNRSDSRVSYIIDTLIGHGESPFGTVSNTLFAPWAFGSRGPIPGVIAAPLTLISGATPAPLFPDQQWAPFDPQGFMIYRIVLMVLAITALFAVYTLVKHLAGRSIGVFAVGIAATTPFFVHEIYFTWPKLIAAAQFLIAAYFILQRRPVWGGLFAGFGYLMHPSALVNVPILIALIVLFCWPRTRDKILELPTTLIKFGVGILVFPLIWAQVNRGHASQGAFLTYVKMSNGVYPTTRSDWLSTRFTALLNTFVPLRVNLVDQSDAMLNAVDAPSGPLVHFFFQYWTSLTFGGAIIFYPALLIGLARMCRRKPLTMLGLVFLPLLTFTIYWGDSITGDTREGLQGWVLVLLVAWAIETAWRAREGRPISHLVRLILVLRPVEIGVMMMVPSIVNAHGLLGTGFRSTDLVAVALMGVALVLMSRMMWNCTRPDLIVGEQPLRVESEMPLSGSLPRCRMP